MYENYSYSIIYLSHHASEWHDNGFFFRVLMIDLCVEANGTWIPLFFDRCFFHWKVYEERSKDCDRTWKWNFQRWGRLTASHSGDISTHLSSIFYVVSLSSYKDTKYKVLAFQAGDPNSIQYDFDFFFIFCPTKLLSRRFFSLSQKNSFQKISFKVLQIF